MIKLILLIDIIFIHISIFYYYYLQLISVNSIILSSFTTIIFHIIYYQYLLGIRCHES